jgi:hypothetical protein
MFVSTYQSTVRIITTVKYKSNNINLMHLVVLEIYIKAEWQPSKHNFIKYL